MASEPTAAPAQAFPPAQVCFLWLRAIAVGLALGTGIGLVRAAASQDAETWSRLYAGLDSLWWLLGGMLLGAVALGVGLYRRRHRRRQVVAVLSVMAAAGIGLGGLFRFEGSYGNLLPRFVWRWSPSSEQQWAAFARERSRSQAATPTKDPAISLRVTPRDYPGFLGPARDGTIRHARLARDWTARPPRELWRHPVGLGWGSFAVVGEFAFTQEQREGLETVVCYELRTGRERWTHGQPVRFSASHGDGPRATPTVAQSRVYTLGATGLLTCLDGVSGRMVWQQPTLAEPERQNLVWGMAGSPLVVDGQVIVSPGGAPGRSLVAYDVFDGTLLWSGGDDLAAYASPMLVDLAGRPQILSFNGAGLCGHERTGGAPLWLHPWVTQGSSRVNIAQPQVVTPFGAPAVNEGFVLISSGYGVGAALLRVRRTDAGWQSEAVWRSRQLASKMSNFLVHGNHVYGLDNGVLVCLDVRDGRRIWKRGRYGHGQLLLVGELILVQAESGEIVLVEATPEQHRELARLPALSDKTWNHPVLADNVLLVRNDREAAAYAMPLVSERPGAP
jgi:outer membrane protein assembly factor BamB